MATGFEERLRGCATAWAGAVVLLAHWRGHLPAEPARLASDERYDRWASLMHDAVAYFESTDLDGALRPADVDAILGWTSDGADVDAVDAVAWGMDTVTSPAYAPAWRDALVARGQRAHVLEDGEAYPVSDVSWGLPDGARWTPRPAALTQTLVGELPHVRIHQASPFEVAVDFGYEQELEAIATGLRTVAAVHPNQRIDEFHFHEASKHRIFPVTCVKPTRQRRRVLALVEHALAHDAQIVVVPELAVDEAIAGELRALVDEQEAHHLVIAGSHHAGAGASACNLALGFIAECDEPLRHTKIVPVSEELGLRTPWKEAIAVAPRPRVTVYVADRYRFCLLICKDFLDANLASAVDRVGVNVFCVPAMSAKSGAFEARARQHVADAQAVTVIANGPLDWGPSGATEHAAVFAQPIRGRETAVTLATGELGVPAVSFLEIGAAAARRSSSVCR